MDLNTLDQRICYFLRDFANQPQFQRRYDDETHQQFLRKLFEFLCNSNEAYIPLLFPDGAPPSNELWSLSKAQGAVEGAEYTEAARGKPCGHILKSGEPSYRCKTCTADETCVLCSRCFDASDHEGHQVTCSVSQGLAGCCDCGDAEAWLRPVHCRIHSPLPGASSRAAEKAPEGPQLPQELLQSMRITIARVLDYLNDVISCSPEQLRIPKTEESVLANERESRLNSPPYTDGSGEKLQEELDTEFAVLLWNDEKHNYNDVQHHIARAAKVSLKKGYSLAKTINTVGRVVIKYDTDVPKLVNIAKQFEVTKLSVTIRSARDTFREQMCAAIIEWLSDIAGCTVGSDDEVLRNIICDELLQPWRRGSQAPHLDVGQDGLFDHQIEEQLYEENKYSNYTLYAPRTQLAVLRRQLAPTVQLEEDEEDDDVANEEEGDDEVDTMEIEADVEASELLDQEADMDDALETNEATLAGYSPPPPPPAPRPGFSNPSRDTFITTDPLMDVPQTPKTRSKSNIVRPPMYWLEKPAGFARHEDLEPREDLWQRTRTDWMILFDLRMWKNIRCIMRGLFISTVVNIPDFKRLLGLRFASLYTPLAQLYLIADREPDFSIISLSLQMLTTPSITAEVIDRGNFLTALFAILYTFFTTRQVGYAEDVNLTATLTLETGVAGNRRLHHFWHDTKCLLNSQLAKERVRNESRYLLQFLDLVKLHQGIVPNKRVTEAHVEYESDEWINAGQMVKEINRLVHDFSQAFNDSSVDVNDIKRAIRQAAQAATINALGAERVRFDKSDLKQETRFKTLLPFEFDGSHISPWSPTDRQYRIVDYDIVQGYMSFHHPLHNMVSWLIECGKGMTPDELRSLLTFDQTALRDHVAPPKAKIPSLTASDYMLAMFDIPLRQIAWLAQMKAGLWVRNGLTLRHQAQSYRSVGQRELTHQRDIFMVQVAFSICDPPTVLASALDRFALVDWATGKYTTAAFTDEHQIVDIAEAFVHMLTVVLSDRQTLQPSLDRLEANIATVRREIAQVLCFKPLSHSALSSLITENIREMDAFEDQIVQLADYHEPKALDDTGTFTLKEEYLQLIDPYTAPYSHNQREEADSIYRKYKAKVSGQKLDDVVFEPQLTQLTSGCFVQLNAFTKTPLFMQILFYFLKYCLLRPSETTKVPTTKVDNFLQSVLHLIVVSILSDQLSSPDDPSAPSFVTNAIGIAGPITGTLGPSLVPLLHDIRKKECYKPFEPKVWHILQLLQKREPERFTTVAEAFQLTFGERHFPQSAPDGEQQESKKKEALERAAKAIAKMKEQQNSFMANQAIDWGDVDDSSSADGVDTPAEDDEDFEVRMFYPRGDCIHCKEPCGDLDRENRLYGMFSFFIQSKILRQTPQWDPDWTHEVFSVPTNLDHSAEHIRPFGVAGQNIRRIERMDPDGTAVISEQRLLGKGFPYESAVQGPVAIGCGSHLMHFSCFEEYNRSTRMRHQSQTARHQPEKLAIKEFLCPFCKALGNAFLPIIWRSRPVRLPKALGYDVEQSFEKWLTTDLSITVGSHSRADVAGALQIETEEIELQRQESILEEYAQRTLVPQLFSNLPQFKESNNPFPTSTIEPYTAPGSGMQFGGLPAFVPQAHNSSEGMTPMLELYRTYGRLRDTMKENKLSTRFEYPAYDARADALDGLTHTDVLSKTLGFSISALEIAQRGVEAQHTLLDKINPSALMHLTVLSETVQSYISIGGLRNKGQTKTNREFVQSQQQQMRQLFIGLEAISGHDRNILTLDFKNLAPLLREDPFIFLAEASIYLVPTLKIEPAYILQLCYIAEVVRVILSCCSIDAAKTGFTSCLTTELMTVSAMDSSSETNSSEEKLEAAAIRALAGAVLKKYHEASLTPPGPVWQNFDSLGDNHPFWEQVRRAVAIYSLPFLRKSLILMNVRHGMDYSNVTTLLDPASSELQRLTSLLRLPSLSQMIATIMSAEPHSEVLQKIIDGWIKHWAWTQEGKHASTSATVTKVARPSFPFSLSHPGIFEIVGLPSKYAAFADAATQLRCPSTGLELSDPCLCLWCGEIFCGQATCCDDIDGVSRFGSVGRRGGAGRHRRK